MKCVFNPVSWYIRHGSNKELVRQNDLPDRFRSPCSVYVTVKSESLITQFWPDKSKYCSHFWPGHIRTPSIQGYNRGFNNLLNVVIDNFRTRKLISLEIDLIRIWFDLIELEIQLNRLQVWMWLRESLVREVVCFLNFFY